MGYRQKILGILTAALLTGQAMAVDFTDTQGHWAQEAIDRWSGCEVIVGYGDGRFGPGDGLTRAQMAVLLDRIFGWSEHTAKTYQDVKGDEWFAGAVLRASAAGVLQGDDTGNARPNDPITRQEAAVMLTRALGLNTVDVAKSFPDEDQIGPWAREAVATMSSLGLMVGTDSGDFAPLQNITRAEAAVILDRAIAGYYEQAGIYRESESGAVTIVAAPGVTLKEMVVEGDLIITPSTAGSETILDGVTVTGTVKVLGDRKAPVLLRGKSKLERVELSGENSCLQSEQSVEIGTLTVAGTGASLRGLKSDQKVIIEAGAENVRINGHLSVPGSTVTAGEDISIGWDDVEVEADYDPSGGGSGTGESGGSSQPSMPSETQSGGKRDEEGNIIIDFDDLMGCAL